MNPKVSVIVPIYNSSKYIAKCCRSLFEQTLDSLQYIFVDDGCSDNSIDIVKAILSEYSNRKDQVLFISLPENKGVGAARNKGIKIAKGEYIIHCDSDDWIEPEAYQTLYEKAISESADIVTFAYNIDSANGNTKKIVSVFQPDPLVFDIGPEVGALFIKLIRRELILRNNLQVPDNIDWGEDLCMSLESFLLSNKTVSINRAFYHYVQHDDSLTHTLTIEKCQNLIRCGLVIEQFLEEHGLKDQYAFQLNWLKFQLKQFFLIFPETRNIPMWKSIYPESHSSILQYNTMIYLKAASWLIVHKCYFVANSLLKLRDFVSDLKNR